MLKYKAVL